jgi:hypothetical protein
MQLVSQSTRDYFSLYWVMGEEEGPCFYFLVTPQPKATYEIFYKNTL